MNRRDPLAIPYNPTPMDAPAQAHSDSEPVSFPGAQAPDRQRSVDSHGVRIAVHEWGRESDPTLLLAHGGNDFGRTFDAVAPRLAAAGWRVVTWDHRGHGDSQHACLYSWTADLRDALSVLDTLPPSVAFVGHSKGGGLMNELALQFPDRVRVYVNLDGLPSSRPRKAPADMSLTERVRRRDQHLSTWLDRGRRPPSHARRPGTLAELAERRGRMNPRLSEDWLRYLVSVGARRDPDGWRWKLDPRLGMFGVGPWRPDWGLRRLPKLRPPLLALLATEQEPMGWGTLPDDVRPHLPGGARVEAVDGCGHFLHIEEPDAISERVLEFLEQSAAR